MPIHPQLIAPLIAIGLLAPLLYLATRGYRRAWPNRSATTRAAWAARLALFHLIYWAGLYGFFIEPRFTVTKEYTVESEQWHGEPIRIVLLSDTHVGGPHVNAARVFDLVDRINALHPDLVVLLGDYANGHAPRAERSQVEQVEITHGMEAFAHLKARLGVVAAIGNHDVWYDREDVTRVLEDAGAAVLWNRALIKSRNGQDFVIAGLEDAQTSHPDFAEALDGAPNADTIVISHSPDPFPDMPSNVAVMLAAHTHCGQVTLPFIGRPVVPSRFGQRYACGAYNESGKHMIVTGGIGTSIVPIRLGNPPEIVIVTLRAAP